MPPGFIHPGPVSFYFPVRSSLLNYAPSVNGASPLIQRGSFVIPGMSGSADHTISEVDLSRTAIIWCGTSGDGGGSDYDLAEVYILNSTTVRAQRTAVPATAVLSVEFCIIEFPAAVIKSIQTGHINMSAAESTQTFTITEVDLSKSIVIFNGTRINTGTSTQYYLIRLYFDDSTTVRATRFAATGITYTAFTVIEFI